MGLGMWRDKQGKMDKKDARMEVTYGQGTTEENHTHVSSEIIRIL